MEQNPYEAPKTTSERNKSNLFGYWFGLTAFVSLAVLVVAVATLTFCISFGIGPFE